MPSGSVHENSERAGASNLNRLLAPATIAVVGGGAWCRQVVRQSKAMGFRGEIFRVHPDPAEVEGIKAFSRLEDLPIAPDAVFLGVNRHATVEAVRVLSKMGAGGAVCFASGFSEASAQDVTATSLQQTLIEAAGAMPVLGPNCYGFINALDGALLWPDQHGCTPVDRGVAILTQSSNIAINLTMQQRGLPIAYAVACGNMAQTTQAGLALSLLDDDRVTALGLHIEGFSNTAEWHAVALKAQEKGVPVVALKVGASEEAQSATISHTASLSGSDAGARALLQRLGFAQIDDLPSFLAALMIAHSSGYVRTSAIASISCSGGEASLVADMAAREGLWFPPLTNDQTDALSDALGPMVALSNPLDYHTYVWGDCEKMAAAWLPMASSQVGLLLIVLDYPHTDPSDWLSATDAAIAVHAKSRCPVTVVSTLPELLPLDVSQRLRAAGVIPLHGLQEALTATAALAARRAPDVTPPLTPQPVVKSKPVTEAQGKALLQSFGVHTPKGVVASRKDNLREAAIELSAPLVLKTVGVAHKSELGGVRLRLSHEMLDEAAASMPGDQLLVEEMIGDAIAELLVGVVRDEAHGFVLTIAAGGVLTEVLGDRQSLLIPVARKDIDLALRKLRIFPVLNGYRGADAADFDAIWHTIDALQHCVTERAEDICEIEINPLICTNDGAWAADALIALSHNAQEEKEPTS